MPYKKSSSCLEHNFATNEICQMMLKSSFTISLIAGILIPGLGKVSQATTSSRKIEKKAGEDSTRVVSKVKLNTENKSETTSLPNSSLVSSVKTLIANLSSFPSAKYSANASTLNPNAELSSTIDPQIAKGDRGSKTILANLPTTLESSIAIVAKPTRVHIVSRGDTVSKIARQYGVSKEDLVRLNKLKNSNIIFISQRIEIPTTKASTEPLANIKQQSTEVTPSLPVEVATKESYKTTSSIQPNSDRSLAGENPYITKLKAKIEQLPNPKQQLPQANRNSSAFENSKPLRDRLFLNTEDTQPKIDKVSVATSLEASNSQAMSLQEDSIALQLPPLPPDEYLPSAFDGYIWPTQGVLTSGYGWRWGRMHRGIDIAAPIGTPIVAAAAGEVINVGWQSGYGNVIKLKHLDGSVTVYGHNHKNLVTHGQKIEQGEQIAEMGNTGRSTGPHVHFEIRLADEAAIDPLALLGSKE